MEQNIYQKLQEIRQNVLAMREDAEGHGDITYVSEENILSHITGVMQRVGVSLVPSIVPGSWKFEPRLYEKKKTDRAGNTTADTASEYLFFAEMNFRWVNNENPEDQILATWPIGAKAGDMAQAMGSALTYGTRYFLLKFFNVATSKDDPDELLRTINAGAADEAALKEMVGRIETAVKKIPSDDKEKRKAVAEALTPVIQRDTGKKSANYQTLKTLEAAAEALAAVEKVLGGGNG